MANRTVKVELIAAVNGYVAGMKQAAAYTTYVGTEAARAAQKLAAQRQVFETTGRVALAVGVIAAAGIAMAVRRFAEFDAAMSNVNAVTQETTENLGLLADAALDAGGRTVFTATEAANAIEELGKAGISTADILGGALDGALDLAASGQLEVARAAEITATTLKQFGLAGSEAGRVADVLSAGAGKALGSVEDLAQAMKFAGPIAGVMGISLEDVTATLALFADQGIVGEQAGTAFRGMLASLQAPSAQARAKLDELGITLYDSRGAFLGMESVVGQLNSTLGDADDQTRDTALGIIFTNAQLTAAQTLVGEAGDKWGEYRAQVEDSGYAARVAADRLDNLRGDLEKLSGAFDTVLIRQGSAANDTLRGMVQGLTFLTELAGDLPPVAINVGLVTAAVALAGGAALVGAGRFVEFKAALQTSGIAARGTAITVGGITAALTVLTFVIGAFVSAQAEAKAAQDAFRDSLDKSDGALTEYSRELIATRLQARGLFEDDIDPGASIRSLEDLGVTQQELTDALFEGGGAYDAILAKLDQYGREGGPRAQLVSDRVRDSLEAVNGELKGGREDWEQLNAAQQSGIEAAEDNADALAVLEGAAADTSGAIDDLSDQILNFGKRTLDTREANRQFEAAIDDLTESIAENGATLDAGTDAGRANESALDDLAEASKKRASAILLETGSQEQATAAIVAGREALINQLATFGIVGPEAEAYADMLGLIPSNINTVLNINANPAFAQLDALRAKLAGNKAALDSLNNWRPSNFSYGPARAGGGILPGTPSRVDNMLIPAASGEYVTNAMASSIPANRAALEYMNAGGNIAGWSGGYMTAPAAVPSAGGGTVTAYTDPAFVRAVEKLAAAHRATLDTVGLSEAAAAGSARSAAVGAR